VTPIKVGEYTVREHPGFIGPPVYIVVDAAGRPAQHQMTRRGVLIWEDEFESLPMALRVAAEAAGIERQRVEVKPGFWRMQKASGLGMHADFVRFVGVPPSPGLLDIAHRHARERYAALGGAA
jgi:hypothetical protein